MNGRPFGSGLRRTAQTAAEKSAFRRFLLFRNCFLLFLNCFSITATPPSPRRGCAVIFLPFFFDCLYDDRLHREILLHIRVITGERDRFAHRLRRPLRERALQARLPESAERILRSDDRSPCRRALLDRRGNHRPLAHSGEP